jgi:hypothetical protein
LTARFASAEDAPLLVRIRAPAPSSSKAEPLAIDVISPLPNSIRPSPPTRTLPVSAAAAAPVMSSVACYVAALA